MKKQVFGMGDFTSCAGYSVMIKHFFFALHFNYPNITGAVPWS